jgi:hypothetical protein
MQQNDFVQARVLQEQQLSFQAKENLANRALEEARIALQAKGIDMQQIEQRYSMINSEIEAGRAAPDAAINYLNTQLQGTGIKLTAVDAEKAAQEAIDADYKAQMYQFAKSHPELVTSNLVQVNENGNSTYREERGLSEEGQRQFMEFFNKSAYGETSVADLVNGIADVKTLQGGADPNSQNAAQYRTLLSKAKDWTPQYEHDGRGVWKEDVEKISNAPAKGTYFKYNGALFYASSDVIEEESGENYEYFKAIDVNTGNTITVKASNNNDGLINAALGVTGLLLPKM